MYDTTGAFGQVRHVTAPLCTRAEWEIHTPFHLNNAGWHRCNGLYRIDRPCGKEGHLLLLSVSDGGVLQLEDQMPVSIPERSAVWIPAGCGHSYYTQQKEIWEFYWLDVSEQDNLSFRGIFGSGPILPLADIRPITAQMENMLGKQFADRQRFLLESSRMIGNIYHMLLAERISPVQKPDEMVSKITRDMERHYERDWNLTELSKRYFISVPQLIRRFKAVTGMPPHTYLMNIRLREAGVYLQHTNWSVEEISRRVGFSCASSFIRKFGAVYGTTPNNYRKSNNRSL